MTKRLLIPTFFLFLFSSLEKTYAQPTNVDSLIQILPQMEADSNKAQVLLMLSKAFLYKDNQKSLDYATSLWSLSQELNLREVALKALYQIGTTQQFVNKYEASVETANRLADLSEQLENDIYLARAWDLIANAHAHWEEFEMAISYFMKELEVLEVLNIKKELAPTYINLALVIGNGMEDHEKALTYLEKSKLMFEELQDTLRLTIALTNMVLQHQELMYNEDTDFHAKKMLEYGVVALAFAKQENLSYLAYQMEFCQEVAKYYLGEPAFQTEKLMSIFDGYRSLSNGAYNVYISVLQVASILNDEQKYQQAKEVLSLMEGITLEEKLFSTKRAYYRELGRTYAGLKEYEEALQTHLIHRKVIDSFYIKKEATALQEIQTKYETEKKEQENQLLTQQNEFLATRNQLYTYIGIGLALVITILSWLFFKLRRQNQIIQHQKSKLEDLNTTKDRLFAIIAHDMRNAVYAFKDVTDSIGYFIRQKQPERIMKIAGAVEQSIDQLGRLLDNLLEWALVQRGDMPYQPELLDLTTTIQNVLHNFERTAQRKAVAFETNLDANTKIFADKNALETIVRNLVSNALKYSKSGGIIRISAQAETHHALVQIQDNGIGMSPAQQARLFQPSKNKSTIGTAGEKGSGLGLILIKELVELNRGKIKVETAEGEGTTFSFSLPKAA